MPPPINSLITNACKYRVNARSRGYFCRITNAIIQLY